MSYQRSLGNKKNVVFHTKKFMAQWTFLLSTTCLNFNHLKKITKNKPLVWWPQKYGCLLPWCLFLLNDFFGVTYNYVSGILNICILMQKKYWVLKINNAWLSFYNNNKFINVNIVDKAAEISNLTCYHKIKLKINMTYWLKILYDLITTGASGPVVQMTFLYLCSYCPKTRASRQAYVRDC